MKLSTKTRYGTRAMLDLALQYENGPIPVKDIAKRQEISPNYLKHVLLSLKAAGFVRSSGGAHGGYVLTMPVIGVRL